MHNDLVNWAVSDISTGTDVPQSADSTSSAATPTVMPLRTDPRRLRRDVRRERQLLAKGLKRSTRRCVTSVMKGCVIGDDFVTRTCQHRELRSLCLAGNVRCQWI